MTTPRGISGLEAVGGFNAREIRPTSARQSGPTRDQRACSPELRVRLVRTHGRGRWPGRPGGGGAVRLSRWREAMLRKRPCRICHQWFRPHPRAGDRQRACCAAPCQAERRRRAVAAWRRRHPDYDRDDRLRRRLQAAPRAVALDADPLAQLNWVAALQRTSTGSAWATTASCTPSPTTCS